MTEGGPPPPLKEWSKKQLIREIERLRAILFEHAEATSDVPRSGGDIVDAMGDPYAQGGVVLDTRQAVLMDELDVSLVDSRPGSGKPPAVALLLQGRINFDTERSRQLYLFDIDGAAAIASQLVGLMARAGELVSSEFRDAFDARIKELP